MQRFISKEMCFSPIASFTAAIFLASIGTYLCNKLSSLSYLPLSLIPWFFAIQQSAEGILWLNISSAGAKNLYLFFAYAFWPMWIPFSFAIAEKKPKQILVLLTGMGIVVGVLLAHIISGSDASFHKFSITYQKETLFQRFNFVMMFFYIATILLPFFITSLKKAWIVGVVVGVASLVIWLTDHLLFVSLWCFLAAILSSSLIFLIPLRHTRIHHKNSK